MSVKSCNSVGQSKGEVVRCGLHKKLKTSKKKYFVLRADTPESSACLEYYDSEKKYISGQAPKRSIALKACFNINKYSENQSKYKHVIALYTKDDCFCMVLENEKELDSWLTALLSLQQGEEAVNGEAPKPTFEHVWKVKVLGRGLGTTGMIGNYNLCLTEDKKLSLIKQDSKDEPMVFHLTNVRSCGSLKNYFFLEIGRSSTLGPGGLWMETEDSNIASNIHSTINHLFFNSHNNQELGPKDRKRSSSATESSKPNNTTYRKQNFSLSKSHGISQGLSSGRERSGSMPSRARTTSEGNHILSNFNRQSVTHSYRPYSGMRDISYSPPTGSPVSPPSVGCSTDSTGSSYSLPDEPDGLCPESDMTICYGIPQDEAIAEEDLDSPCGYTCSNYLPMAGGQSSDDGYVDMSPKGRHHATSPTASMSSVTSGTPSTDNRFHDYQLDKVQSYFSDENDWLRPMRAYSVGSRPDHRNKAQVDMSGVSDSSRTRAFSVGSKTKKIPRILPPHHPHPSVKSSSAPILSSSSRTYSSSHGSLGPMGDLMEMDFSKSGRDLSGYMEMQPKSNNSSGYVEMKPGVEVNREVSPYVDMSSGNGSSPAKPSYMSSSSSQSSHHNDDCIVDLNQYKMHQLLSDEPRRRNHAKPSSSPNTNSQYKWPDYMDMSSSKKSDKNGNSHKLTDLTGSNNELSHQETPEGYVEMTLGKKQHQRQSSLDSAQIRSATNEDYTNMSVVNSKKKREKNRSQPIAIQSSVTSNSGNRHSISNSPKSFSSLLTGSRKFSCGTPPRMHLPLNSSNNVNSNHGQPTSPYSSLPRQRTRCRRDSKDSSSSTVTTPSSSSTIFSLSLNSPSSPNKPSPVAAANPVTNNNYNKLPILGPVLSMFMNNNNNKENNCGSDDYTMMDFEKKKHSAKKDTSEYVNFNPAEKSKTESCSNSSSDTEKDMGDYAIMKPGEVDVKKINNFRPIKEDCKKDEDNKSAGAQSNEGDTSKNGEMSSQPSGPTAVSGSENAWTSRPSSTSSELCSSSSTLVGSRPESVNSDRIRPASTNSEQLHYASLDLVTDEASGSSPRSNKSPESGNAAAGSQSEPPFSYAQIDFVKTEGLKQQQQQQQHSLPNAKVKH